MIVPLDAPDKESEITQLVHALNDAGALQNCDAVLDVVKTREKPAVPELALVSPFLTANATTSKSL